MERKSDSVTLSISGAYLPEGGESLLEFSDVKLLVAIVVHSSEDGAKGSDANSTTVSDLVFEGFLELLYSDLEIDAEICH